MIMGESNLSDIVELVSHTIQCTPSRCCVFPVYVSCQRHTTASVFTVILYLVLSFMPVPCCLDAKISWTVIEVRNHPKEVNNHAWGGCIYIYIHTFIYIYIYIYMYTYVYNIYTYRTLLHLHMKKIHIYHISTALRNLQVPVNVHLDVGFLFADPWNQLCGC